MVERSGIVTPEAVVLEFETAGMASRMLAALLDSAVQFLALLGILLASFGLTEAGIEVGGLGNAFLYFVVFLLLFAYPAGFETLWRGRTPGKAALGLRVVTVEGGPIRFRHAAIRAILGLIDKYAFSAVPGVLALLLTRRNQRLGDLVAGTIVLRERSGARAPQAVAFAAPRGLEAYVAALDVSALDRTDYVTIRSFLLRAPTLAPAARDALARQVATPVLARLHTVPPAGLPPEVFLVCVAAAHQQRHAPPATVAAPQFHSVWSDPSLTAAAPAPATAPVTSDTGFTAPA